MLSKFWSFVRSIIRSFVRSFIVRSYSIFIARPFVRPNNLFSTVMLPKFRSFVRSIIRSFVRSFIVPIHRSFIVPIHCSFLRTIIHHYSSSFLFTVTIHHCYYSSMMSISPVLSSLLFTVTIHHHYYSSMISIGTIHRYYSSIIRSPQNSTTHPSCCPVHLRPARPTFQSYELRWLWFFSSKNFLSGHPSQISPSWARLTLRFFRTRLTNSDSNNSCF
jgi:hypothetical protein